MKKFRVMVVDDDKDILIIIKTHLMDIYETITTFDPVDVIAKVKLYEPDLIILDIMLPKVSGFELCQQIRALPRFQKTPIIFLSAKTKKDDHKLGYQVGANLYLDKPFEPKRLVKNIDVLLRDFYPNVPRKNLSYSDICGLESGTAKLRDESEEEFKEEVSQPTVSITETITHQTEEYSEQPIPSTTLSDKKEEITTESVDLEIKKVSEEIIIEQEIEIEQSTEKEKEIIPETDIKEIPKSQKAKKTKAKKKQPLIIVVDDDEEIVDVLDATLSIKGYRVLGAQDGNSGFKKISAKEPDLVILDLHLPKMTGQEVIVKMRKTPNLANIPILVLTATTKFSPLTDDELAQSYNVHDFITKPFDAKDILKRIAKILPHYE